MDDKLTMFWKDWRGKEVIREVRQIIDLRDFVGTPGYALLVVAANTHLSIGDIHRFLRDIAKVGRSRGWIQRRRWMYSVPDTVRGSGIRPNADGKDEQAHAIMRANPTVSVRQLTRLLSEAGITRGREWVRQSRCG